MIYIRRSDGVLAAFGGMSEESIRAMLAAQGLTCELIDEATFKATEVTR